MTIISCGISMSKKYNPHTPLPEASPPSGPSAGEKAPNPAPTKLMKHTIADIIIVFVLLRHRATIIIIGFAIIRASIRHPKMIPRCDVC